MRIHWYRALRPRHVPIEPENKGWKRKLSSRSNRCSLKSAPNYLTYQYIIINMIIGVDIYQKLNEAKDEIHNGAAGKNARDILTDLMK